MGFDKYGMKGELTDERRDLVIIGGGAAGFFTAAIVGQEGSGMSIAILEQRSQTLSKVRVSGGGRCNVTHACYEPQPLTEYYPRGRQELLGPFHRWGPSDVMDWFEGHGVPLKEEADGRVFPTTDSSETIIDCLTTAVNRSGSLILTGASVETIQLEGEAFQLGLSDGRTIRSSTVMLATGGLREGGALIKALRRIGHRIESLAPALFAFGVRDIRLNQLAGIAVGAVRLRTKDGEFESEGALLITHRGISGPAVLKLSSWGARWMQEKAYRFQIIVDWTGEGTGIAQELLKGLRSELGGKRLIATPQFQLPRRLWERLVAAARIPSKQTWAQLTEKQLDQLVNELTRCEFAVAGKSMNKEEFVTCGGVSLAEVHFATMESKKVPGLYFAGEVLDIDALTGGFNFQAAWTTSYLAGKAIAERWKKRDKT